MKIKFLKDRVTKTRPEDQERFEAGKVYDLPEASAVRWINRQVAVLHEDRTRGAQTPRPAEDAGGDLLPKPSDPATLAGRKAK